MILDQFKNHFSSAPHSAGKCILFWFDLFNSDFFFVIIANEADLNRFQDLQEMMNEFLKAFSSIKENNVLTITITASLISRFYLCPKKHS